MTTPRDGILRFFVPFAQAIAGTGAVVVAGIYAYTHMFIRFTDYDDEGYVMLTVKKFLDGLPLNTAVFTQYGPFYYQFKKLLFAITGGPVTHDITRLMTIGQWMVAAALCAWCVYRLTRSGNWAIAAFAQAMLHGWGLVSEPGHPQELTLLLLAISVAVAATGGTSAVSIALLGSIAAFAFLTKINFGLYFATSLGLALLAVFPPQRTIRAAFYALAAAAIALPFALMRQHLAAWAMNYAALVSLTTLAGVVWIRRAYVGDQAPPRRLLAMVVGAAVGAGVILGLTLFQGTHAADLVEGLILRPMRLVFAIPMTLETAELYPAIASVGLAAALALLTGTGLLKGRALEITGTVLKLGFGLAGFYILNFEWDLKMTWLAPFIWIVLVPSPGVDTVHARFARTFLCAVAALQLLMAYPVAGTQKGWSTFVIVPALAVCAADGWLGIVRAWRPWIRHVAELAVLAGMIVFWFPKFEVEKQLRAYELGVKPDLWGMDRARLPRDTVNLYRWMVVTLTTHCDALVTQPGYDSLYFWTRIEPLTGFNTTVWMTLLTDEEQIAIRDKFAQHPRACVIYSEPGTGAGTQGRPYLDRPLVKYIRESFRTVQTVGQYQFMIRNGRPWLEASPTDAAIDGTFSSMADVKPISAERFFGKASASILLSLRTTGSGGVFGCQSERAPAPSGQWIPVIFVNQWGQLNGQFYPGRVATMMTRHSVNDGQWHRIVLARGNGQQRLFVDGKEIAVMNQPAQDLQMSHCQLGVAQLRSWPGGNNDWMPFTGEVKQFQVVERTFSAADAAEDWGKWRQ